MEENIKHAFAGMESRAMQLHTAVAGEQSKTAELEQRI